MIATHRVEVGAASAHGVLVLWMLARSASDL
jgi:hypothetical protein